MTPTYDDALENLFKLAGDGGVNVGAVPVYFDDRDSAREYAEFYPPSLVLVRGESETFLIYALDQMVSPGHFPSIAATGFPMVGMDGWEFANDDHEAACAAGDYPVHTIEELAFINDVGLDVEAPAASDDQDDIPFHSDSSDVPVSSPETTPDELPRFNDAYVHGVVTAEVLEATIRYGFAQDGIAADFKKGTGWDAKEESLGTFLGGLSRHRVGMKEGSAILQGVPIDRVRNKQAIELMGFIGLDVDNGTPIEVALERLKAFGRFAVVYTTNSHNGTRTARKQDGFVGWAKKAGVAAVPTDETMARFLVEERDYQPEIAASIRYAGMEHTKEGMQVFADHAPLPKYRIIVPLAEPFHFAQHVATVTGSHQESIKVWARKYLGLGQMLGLTVDPSCIDPSRVLFLPRHKEGADFEIHIVGGELLRIEDIVEAELGKKRIANPFAAAAEDLGASERHGGYGLTTAGGVDLLGWNKERGVGFEIGRAFLAHAHAHVRQDQGSKVTVECPFDHLHSNSGDLDDGGAFVADASTAEGGANGFVFKCMHGSCAEKGKLDMLAEAIKLRWLPEDVLFDSDYMSVEFEVEEAQDEDKGPSKEETLKVLREHVDRFDKSASREDIIAVIESAVGVQASSFQIDGMIDSIVGKTGQKKSILAKELKRLQHEQRKQMTEQDAVQKYNLKPRPGTVPLITDMLDDYALLDRSKAVITHGNMKTPRVFRYSSDVWRCVLPQSQDLVLEKISEDILTSEAIRYATYFTLEGGNKPIFPPKRIMGLLLVDPELRLPKLEGFARMPYVSKTGQIVRTPGYNTDTGFMLHMPADITIPEIADDPQHIEIADAIQLLLDEVFGDFPFDDGGGDGEASRAHLMCLLMEPVVRPLIAGPTPGYYIQKPMAGTGGTLLVKNALRIATGAENPSSATESISEEERRKAITASLIQGRSHFWLDNVNKTLDSPAYANLLTAVTWEDRELGSSKTVDLPNRCTKVFSGNNMRFSHELTRRGVLIRLDAKRDPLARTEFRISDLDAYVIAKRGELAAAVLTLVRYWINKGMPKRKEGRKLASFESWCEVMGGILQTIGVPGFLGNLDTLQDGANDEKAAWNYFISAWLSRTDWATPQTISDPDLKPESLASLLFGAEDAPEIPGVYGKNSSQFAGNLRKALKLKSDNIFQVEDAHGRKVSVAIRRQRNSRGSDEFCLEEIVETVQAA